MQSFNLLSLKTSEKLALTMAAFAAIVGFWILRNYDPNWYRLYFLENGKFNSRSGLSQ